MPKFKAKSGFKMKGFSYPGQSPITKSPYTMNNFGMSPGDSPYKQEDENGEEKEKFGAKAKKAGKNVLNTAIAGLTSGLDAVYGTGKVIPKKPSSDKEKKEISDEIVEDNNDTIAQTLIKTESPEPKEDAFEVRDLGDVYAEQQKEKIKKAKNPSLMNEEFYKKWGL